MCIIIHSKKNQKWQWNEIRGQIYFERYGQEIITVKLNVSVHEEERYNKLEIEAKSKTYELKQSSTNNNNNSIMNI